MKLPPFNGFSFNGGRQLIDETVTIGHIKETFERPIVACSLGCHVNGLVLPHPDPGHTESLVQGALYRFCRRIDYDNTLLDEFASYVEKWVCRLTPLSADSDTTLETWLSKTGYSEVRKNELRKALLQANLKLGDKIPDEYVKVKSHMKDEPYIDYKYPRPINSRHDVFKCLVGPITQLLNEALFSLPYFIKKIPICDRPKFVRDFFMTSGVETWAGDFSSFEAHFIKKLQLICEFVFFKHMVSNLPDGQAYLDLMSQGKLTLNKLTFKNFCLWIESKRMSGEMDTSLSNSFSNLMFVNFVCFKSGCNELDDGLHCKSMIEGDDSLFQAFGKQLIERIFQDFGFVIKLLKFDDLNSASFCGMVFDPEDLIIVTDPIEAMVKLGWTRNQYCRSKPSILLSLLRAKSLSMLYQYNGCPILSSMAKAYIRLTPDIDLKEFLRKQGTRAFDSYKIHRLYEAIEYFNNSGLIKEPGLNTRFLVQSLYGIHIQEQIKLEQYFDSLEVIEPIPLSLLTRYPDVFKHCWDNYVRYVDVDHYYDGQTLFVNRKRMFKLDYLSWHTNFAYSTRTGVYYS